LEPIRVRERTFPCTPQLPLLEFLVQRETKRKGNEASLLYELEPWRKRRRKILFFLLIKYSISTCPTAPA
ncbi:hypothetical protein VIGAN_03290000, partial [Vigna angularis var. angularis]